MTRILVVDDEVALVELVRGYLEREQYEVLTASDGRTALDLARTAQPDLIVLDVMLPELDGIEVCRQLRQFSDAYVILLTARAEEIDKILGLTVGADDYLTKPFSPRELVARIKARLRRPRQAAIALHTGSDSLDDTPTPQRWEDLTIDEAQHEVTLHGQPVELTAREFALLLALARHPGRVFTRAQLLERVWGDAYYDEHVVDVHIFIIFAFSFTRPHTARDWRSFGAFSAFLVALFTEMYGFPLTICLLSGSCSGSCSSGRPC